MGLLEWIGAHLLAPFVNLWRAFNARPRPDIRILDVVPAGAGSHAFFTIAMQNYGTQPARVTVTAHVGDRVVAGTPVVLDMLVNTPPARFTIGLQRPDLADEMPECNDGITLYGETLLICATVGKRRVQKTWHEEEYDPITDRERFEVQQRYWRRGRGEETAEDRRVEAQSEHEKRIESGDAAKGRYDPNV